MFDARLEKRYFIRYMLVTFILLVSAFAFSGCAEQQAAAGNNQRFYFVQVTDTHFGKMDNDKRTADIVESINKLPIDYECVVVTGDIFSDNITKPQVLKTAKQTLGRLRGPVHYLPGNHDILPENYEDTARLYRENFGELFSKAEYEGVVFLFAYTEPVRKQFEYDGPDLYEWVGAELEASGNKPVLLFHHAPSGRDFYHLKYHDSWPEREREKWHDVLNSGNVKAVVTGHFHRPELHWAGDVPIFVSTPVAGFWDREATYRVYEYNNGKLGYFTVYLK